MIYHVIVDCLINLSTIGLSNIKRKLLDRLGKNKRIQKVFDTIAWNLDTFGGYQRVAQLRGIRVIIGHIIDTLRVIFTILGIDIFNNFWNFDLRVGQGFNVKLVDISLEITIIRQDGVIGGARHWNGVGSSRIVIELQFGGKTDGLSVGKQQFYFDFLFCDWKILSLYVVHFEIEISHILRYIVS